MTNIGKYVKETFGHVLENMSVKNDLYLKK